MSHKKILDRRVAYHLNGEDHVSPIDALAMVLLLRHFGYDIKVLDKLSRKQKNNLKKASAIALMIKSEVKDD